MPSLRVAISLSAAVSGPLFAQPFTYQRVVDTNTVIPNTANKEYVAFAGASLSDNYLTFVGYEGGTTMGMYRWNAGAVSLIADKTTPIPGGAGNFNAFLRTDTSGSRSAFDGYNSISGEGGVFSFSSGSLGIVAKNGTVVPGFGTLAGADTPSSSGQQVSFRGGTNTVLAVFRHESGTYTKLVDSNTPVPGGTGNFPPSSSQFTSLRAQNNAVTFRGYDGTNKSGIYRADDGGLSVRVDTHMDGPNGLGKFKGVDYLDVDGNDLAFTGATEVDQFNPRLFTLRNGQFALIASGFDVSPIVGLTLGSFSEVSLHNGAAAWYDGNQAVYANYGGSINAIAGPGMMIEGKEVSRALTWSDARDGDRLAVHVIFSDDTPGVPDRAIYIVTLPAPGALAAFGAGLLFAARRKR